LRPIAQTLDNLVGPVTDAQHEMPRALVAEQSDLDLKKWPATHWRKALGTI
jgi:hypothetical protein